jgi:hypothetical protein
MTGSFWRSSQMMAAVQQTSAMPNAEAIRRLPNQSSI